MNISEKTFLNIMAKEPLFVQIMHNQIRYKLNIKEKETFLNIDLDSSKILNKTLEYVNFKNEAYKNNLIKNIMDKNLIVDLRITIYDVFYHGYIRTNELNQKVIVFHKLKNLEPSICIDDYLDTYNNLAKD